jgi:hypothetical protein
MSKIKYMGSADVRLVEAGEDFAGRLATPLAETIQWDKNNNWVVDSEELGLSDEVVGLLLEEGQGFLDVTGLERVPVNLVQSIFYGLKDAPEAELVVADDDAVNAAAEVTPNPAPRGGRITPPEDQATVPAR